MKILLVTLLSATTAAFAGPKPKTPSAKPVPSLTTERRAELTEVAKARSLVKLVEFARDQICNQAPGTEPCRAAMNAYDGPLPKARHTEDATTDRFGPFTSCEDTFVIWSASKMNVAALNGITTAAQLRAYLPGVDLSKLDSATVVIKAKRLANVFGEARANAETEMDASSCAR